MLAGQAARVFATPRALVATGSPCAGSPCFRSMLSAPNNAPHLCQKPHNQSKIARRHAKVKWKLAGSVETLERRELHGRGHPNFNDPVSLSTCVSWAVCTDERFESLPMIGAYQRYYCTGCLKTQLPLRSRLTIPTRAGTWIPCGTPY